MPPARTPSVMPLSRLVRRPLSSVEVPAFSGGVANVEGGVASPPRSRDPPSHWLLPRRLRLRAWSSEVRRRTPVVGLGESTPAVGLSGLSLKVERLSILGVLWEQEPRREGVEKEERIPL